MVARVQPDRGLSVVLYCGGMEPFEVTAKDPANAATVAIGLISIRGALHAGDRLIVRRPEDEPDVPEASRASHYS
jgi:hypothetical protein